MTAIDLAFGFLAGVVSCLTPQGLLLFPLALAAAGAVGRPSVIAPAVCLGLSLVLTGPLAGSLGFVFGIEAIWFRRLVCALLVLRAIVLMSASMADRYPLLTGGQSGLFAAPGASARGGAFRRVLLALLLGANWAPRLGPTLGRASLMAADTWNSALALAILFVFGMRAAAPWIVLGRILRLVSRPFAGAVLDGMAGMRILGLALLVVAVLGSTGWDIAMAHGLDAMLPAWTGKLATTF